jgi:hypothetical protein
MLKKEVMRKDKKQRDEEMRGKRRGEQSARNEQGNSCRQYQWWRLEQEWERMVNRRKKNSL